MLLGPSQMHVEEAGMSESARPPLKFPEWSVHTNLGDCPDLSALCMGACPAGATGVMFCSSAVAIETDQGSRRKQLCELRPSP